jgi:hypothetical protein
MTQSCVCSRWQVVPVETASSELERAAATLRPKLHRHLPRFLVDIPRVALTHPSVQATYSSSSAASPEALEEVDVSDPERALASLQVDRSVRHQRVCVICSDGKVKAYAHGPRPSEEKLCGGWWVRASPPST